MISPFIHLIFAFLVIAHLAYKRFGIVIIVSLIYVFFDFGKWAVIEIIILNLILFFTLHQTINGNKIQAATSKPKIVSSKVESDSSSFWVFFDSSSNDHSSDLSGDSSDGGDGGGD